MRKVTLAKHQKDEVFRAIQAHGLQPSEFSWEEQDSHYEKAIVISVIVYKPTGHYFRFDRSPTGIPTGSYSPGQAFTIEEYSPGLYTKAFPIDSVTTWLKCLKREVESPDFWQTISQEKDLIAASSGENLTNTPFSVNEKTQVTKCLYEIKRYLITTQQLSKEQQNKVEPRFNYLEEAITRLGRIEWLNILIAQLIAIAIELGLRGDSTHDLLTFAAQIVRQLLGTLLSPPYLH